MPQKKKSKKTKVRPSKIRRDSASSTPKRFRHSDGWQNTITGLGRSRDKRTGTLIVAPLVQSSRDEYDHWYHSDHTAQKIAKLPAREMTREWISLQVDDSVESETEVKTETSTSDKMITAKQVMQALDDLSAKVVCSKALTWARVHGGALIYMVVDDGADDETPLNLASIKSFSHMLVFDRWECEITEVVVDRKSERFGQPEQYRIRPDMQYGINFPSDGDGSFLVHASRVIRIDGVLTSKYRMQLNQGWADSVYTAMKTTLEDYGISWAVVPHLLQDFSQAVLKMRGLHEALVAQEGDLVIDRMTAMDLCRSVARAIPIDAEDEDFFRAQTPMGGLPETIDRLMLRVAEAAEMPATLLFGQSPAGLNATGDSDIRFFYDQIKAKQEESLRDVVDTMLEVLFAAKDGPTQGREPENWSYEFNPLWQETDQERALTRKTQAETDAIYLADGVLDSEEVAMSRFGGDTYSTDTVLDMEKREQVAEEEEEEPLELPEPPDQPQPPEPDNE
jgi:phage-related protein (TIGR01555 family)